MSSGTGHCIVWCVLMIQDSLLSTSSVFMNGSDYSNDGSRNIKTMALG